MTAAPQGRTPTADGSPDQFESRVIRGVLICHQIHPNGNVRAEWTYWDDREQARQAEAELTPCGPRCVAIHSVAGIDSPPDRRRSTDRAHRPNRKAVR